MTVTDQLVPAPAQAADAVLQQKARDHLWPHFSRQSALEESGVPIIVKGEGHHIWDATGRKLIDGLSGLFVVNAGHGRRRLAEAAAKQAEQLAFFPIWSYAHPAAIELAEQLANEAPGDLNRVSSPPAAARRSRPPTSSRRTTSSSSASRTSTR